MKQWYKKSINIVTKKNFILIFSTISSFGFYIIEKISNKELAGLLAFYSFFLGIGEYVGEKVTKKKKNYFSLFILIITIFLFIFSKLIKNTEILLICWCGFFSGSMIGLEFKKLKDKGKVNY